MTVRLSPLVLVLLSRLSPSCTALAAAAVFSSQLLAPSFCLETKAAAEALRPRGTGTGWLACNGGTTVVAVALLGIASESVGSAIAGNSEPAADWPGQQ